MAGHQAVTPISPHPTTPKRVVSWQRRLLYELNPRENAVTSGKPAAADLSPAVIVLLIAGLTVLRRVVGDYCSTRRARAAEPPYDDVAPELLWMFISSAHVSAI